MYKKRRKVDTRRVTVKQTKKADTMRVIIKRATERRMRKADTRRVTIKEATEKNFSFRCVLNCRETPRGYPSPGSSPAASAVWRRLLIAFDVY